MCGREFRANDNSDGLCARCRQAVSAAPGANNFQPFERLPNDQ